MSKSVVFVEELPEVTIGRDGVSTVYRSGGEVYPRRFTRALWRRFLETEIRRLNEYELAERAERTVVRMERKGGH